MAQSYPPRPDRQLLSPEALKVGEHTANYLVKLLKRKVDREDQTAMDAVSQAQVALETGWDFSLPFPSDCLEDNLLGTPPMAAVGENLVACAPAFVPSDDLEQLLFVVSPPQQTHDLRTLLVFALPARHR